MAAMAAVSTQGLYDELRALERSGSLDRIGSAVHRAEALITELIDRIDRNESGALANFLLGRRELIEKRGGLRAILGARGSPHWLMKSGADFELVAQDAAASARLGPFQFAITHACHAYESLGRYDLAAHLWEQFVKLYPRERQGWQSLAYVLKRLRQWDKELQARSVLCKMMAHDGMPLIERSNCLRELGLFLEAKADVDAARPKLKERERNRADVLVNIGATHMGNRELPQALNCFNQVLRREGAAPHRLAQFQRSAVLQMCDKFGGALVGYRSILMRLRDGGDIPADAAWNTALILHKTAKSPDDTMAAINYIQMARTLYTSPENLAQCSAKIAQLAAGLDFKDVAPADRAQRHAPLPADKGQADAIEEEWVYLNRLHSECYSERVRERVFPKIIDIATHLIEIDPRGRPLYYLLRAEVLQRQKKESERIETMRRVLELFPPSAFTSAIFDESLPGIQMALAGILKREGKTDDALRVYDEIVDTVDKSAAHKPTPFRILNELARERAILFRASTRRREASMPDRDRLIELNPLNPDYWRERAQTYRIMGLRDKEQADLNRAVAIEYEHFTTEPAPAPAQTMASAVPSSMQLNPTLLHRSEAKRHHANVMGSTASPPLSGPPLGSGPPFGEPEASVGSGPPIGGGTPFGPPALNGPALGGPPFGGAPFVGGGGGGCGVGGGVGGGVGSGGGGGGDGGGGGGGGGVRVFGVGTGSAAGATGSPLGTLAAVGRDVDRARERDRNILTPLRSPRGRSRSRSRGRESRDEKSRPSHQNGDKGGQSVHNSVGQSVGSGGQSGGHSGGNLSCGFGGPAGVAPMALSTPGAAADAAASLVPRAGPVPRADWTKEQVADWVCNLGGNYLAYRQSVIDNGIDGSTLVLIANEEQDKDACELLYHGGISNSLHRRGILQQIRAHLQKRPAK